MLKVEMTGTLFKVASALTQANIPFILKQLKGDWVLDISPPTQHIAWTIKEDKHEFVSVWAVRGNGESDVFVTEIFDDQDPLQMLASAACYFIEGDDLKFDKDPVWLKLFLKYKLVKEEKTIRYVRN